MKYSVILHNYKKNELTCMNNNFTQTLADFSTIENALFYVEEFISEYIENLQGDKQFDYLFEAPQLGTGFKDGFYCIIYRNHLNRYTIYRRTRSIGWVMNSQEDVAHFEIFISCSISKNQLITDRNSTLFRYKNYFNKCLKEIDQDYVEKLQNSNDDDKLKITQNILKKSLNIDILKNNSDLDVSNYEKHIFDELDELISNNLPLQF